MKIFGKKKNIIIHSLLFLLVLTFNVKLLAREETKEIKPLQQKIENNKAIITLLKKRIEEQKVKQIKEEKMLQECDEKIDALMGSLKKIETSIKTSETELNQLKHSMNSLNQSMQEKQENLSNQMKAIYLFQKHKPLKLFLSQKNPFQLERSLHYYRYLERYNLEAFTRILTEYQQLSERQKEAEILAFELNQLKDTKMALISNLEQQRKERRNMLSEIKKDLSKNEKNLTHSLQSEKELVDQLKIIQSTLESHPFKESNTFFKHRPFTEAKGKLLWPIRHKINASLRSPIVIKANGGEPVYASYDGRVVFADRLRGFGLLMIIDHHEGYMSLYGHNQILYKNIGDKVQKGDLIGRVGSGSTDEETGLYFEIRRNGKPENLSQWFH